MSSWEASHLSKIDCLEFCIKKNNFVDVCVQLADSLVQLTEIWQLN